MFIELVMPSNNLIFCCPFLFFPSIFPSIRVFSNEFALCIKWAKYWSFSFSISPSSEYSGLISFRIHWFDFLAAQGTLNSLLQHHSLKPAIFQCSTFIFVEISNLYMTIGKTIAWTVQTFVSKVMSLQFNKLSRFVSFSSKKQTSFKCVPAVTIHSDFGAQENEICHCFHFFPYYLPWTDGTKSHDLCFSNAEFLTSFFTLLFHPHQETL